MAVNIPYVQNYRLPENNIVARLVKPQEIAPRKKNEIIKEKPALKSPPGINTVEKPIVLPRRLPPVEHKKPPKTMEGKGGKRLPGGAEKGQLKHYRVPLEGEGLKLAEKKAIERVIKGGEDKTPEGSGGKNGGRNESGITFSTREYKYYGYKMRLKEKIEETWRYPAEAARKGIYADLYIRFTILRDGKLGAVELLRTSGYKMLDDAAMKAVKDASPFWPLPPEWKEDSFTITGHFVYSLNSYYLR